MPPNPSGRVSGGGFDSPHSEPSPKHPVEHHWQIAGPTFYQLHLLFDKHSAEQTALVDEIAERIQQLGGVSLSLAADIAEETQIARPPLGSEAPDAQIQCLLDAHEIVLRTVRQGGKAAADAGDDGTNDLLDSGVLRRNETQVWFVSEHLASLKTR